MQVDAIEQMTEATPGMVTMVNEWLVAGLLSMIAVSTTLAAFGIAVKDTESKATADFLTAPISRATIQFSYVLNAFVIGCIFSFIALIGCEIFIVATGGELLSFGALIKVISILLLSVLLASVLMFFSSYLYTHKILFPHLVQLSVQHSVFMWCLRTYWRPTKLCSKSCDVFPNKSYNITITKCLYGELHLKGV